VTQRVVAIGLKIPDNEAYTALVALRRLGVDVARVERNEIWDVDDEGEAATFAQRVAANEAIFNPNKHRLTVLDDSKPRQGETWIAQASGHDEVREHLGGKSIAGVKGARRYVAWLLRDAAGEPVRRAALESAVERLLCNPSIEKAIYR
jgi:phosphoribosylformylglycinamidine (FGAM) synthase PurS component